MLKLSKKFAFLHSLWLVLWNTWRPNLKYKQKHTTERQNTYEVLTFTNPSYWINPNITSLSDIACDIVTKRGMESDSIVIQRLKRRPLCMTYLVIGRHPDYTDAVDDGLLDTPNQKMRLTTVANVTLLLKIWAINEWVRYFWSALKKWDASNSSKVLIPRWALFGECSDIIYPQGNNTKRLFKLWVRKHIFSYIPSDLGARLVVNDEDR